MHSNSPRDSAGGPPPDGGAPPSAGEAGPESGGGEERLGRYRLVRPLSRGGMALVYEARRESLAGVAPRVAIKLILPEHAGSRDFKDMFENEAKLGAEMRHQNLVQIQDFDHHNGRYFLVMEYVEGFTLRKIISLAERAGMDIPLMVIAEIGRQACDGLHYAHNARDDDGRPLRLVHRDIKPSNLILGPHGIVKVLDFGISKGSLREERKGSVRGTWGYMAPEQAVGGDVGPTSDLFGLAVVLYELAAQQPMFADSTKDEIRRRLADDHAAKMASSLDGRKYGALVGPLIRALQRDPAARFETAEAFGRALADLVVDPVTARDQLTQFYETIAAVDASLPHTGGTMAPSTTPQEPKSSPVDYGMVAAYAVTGTLAASALLVFIAAFALFTQRSEDMKPLPPPPSSTAIAAGTPAREVPPPPPARPVAPRHPEPTIDPDEAAAGLLGEDGAPPEGVVVQPLPAPAEPPAVEVTPATLPVTDAPPAADADLPTVDVYIAARQPAEVHIDGDMRGYSPYQGPLTVGPHRILLVQRDGGAKKEFDVIAREGEPLKRVYDFSRADFR